MAESPLQLMTHAPTVAPEEILELTPRHRRALESYARGERPATICADLDLTSLTLKKLLESKLGWEYLNGVEQQIQQRVVDVTTRLRNLAPNAIDVLEELMGDGDVPSGVRRASANDILDRAGYGKTSHLEVTKREARLVLEGDQAIAFAETLREKQ